MHTVPSPPHSGRRGIEADRVELQALRRPRAYEALRVQRRARKVGLDPKALADTFSKYNEH